MSFSSQNRSIFNIGLPLKILFYTLLRIVIPFVFFFFPTFLIHMFYFVFEIYFRRPTSPVLSSFFLDLLFLSPTIPNSILDENVLAKIFKFL